MQDNGLVQDPAVAEMANCNDQPPPTVSVVQIELACIRTSAAMTASGMCPEPTSIKVRYFIKRSRHAGNRIWTSFRAARWSKPHEGVEASPSRNDEDPANSSYSVWAIWQPFFRKFYSKAWSLRWRGPSGRQARLGRTICRLHAVFLVRLPIVATQPAPRRPSALARAISSPSKSHARRGPDRPQACSREPGPAAMSMVRGAAPATNRAHISRYARSSSSARRAGLNRAALAPFGEQSAPERGEAVRVAGEFDRDRLVLVERGCHQLGQTGRAQDA
ncbi:MAG: hypothetical protein K0S81_3331 [Rhodospirillales bacterium]|nr:hypothetical protein [Rhodospirillales bacterium]